MEKLWAKVRTAVSKREYIAITIPLPRGSAEVRTIKGGKPWDSDTLIQIAVDRPGMCWRKTCETIQAAKEALNGEYRKPDQRE